MTVIAKLSTWRYNLNKRVLWNLRIFSLMLGYPYFIWIICIVHTLTLDRIHPVQGANFKNWFLRRAIITSFNTTQNQLEPLTCRQAKNHHHLLLINSKKPELRSCDNLNREPLNQRHRMSLSKGGIKFQRNNPHHQINKSAQNNCPSQGYNCLAGHSLEHWSIHAVH